MKIAILKYGREKMGGHSALMSELRHYCDENQHSMHCYSYTIGGTKRKNYKFELAENFVFDEFCAEDANQIANELESFDLLIMLEPATKAGTKEDGRIYTSIYERVQNPLKWMLSYNIKLGFIKRVRNVLDTIAASDVISTHSENADWAIIGKRAGKPWIKTPLFKRIDEFTDYFNNEDRQKNILFAGRYEAYKGPQFMISVSKILAENGIQCNMIGIDRSPASYHGLLVTEEVTSGRIKVGGPYTMQDGFKRMSESLFSFAPMKLTVDECSGILEYSQVEGIACGCIPVLHKNSAEFEYRGVKFGDIPYFAIWFDENNPDECAKEIVKVANDKELQKLYKGTALKVLKEMYSKENLKLTIDAVMNLAKNRCTSEDILKSFDWNEDEIETYKEADSTEYYVKADIPNLTKRKVNIITGRYGGTTPYVRKLQPCDYDCGNCSVEKC